MPSGRSTGPASRPPRRGAAARPSAGASGKARASTPKAAATRATGPRASATAPTTAKVVQRSASGWRGRLGGAVSNRAVRRGAVLTAIGVFITVLLTSSVAAWVQQRGQIASLRERVATQASDVEALRAERERWDDPAYVEQQARQRLKFVRPGERSYTVLDPQPESADTPAIAGPGIDEAASVLPWYSTVWESVRTADAPGAHR